MSFAELRAIVRQDWADPVLARPFEVRDGTLLVPDVPGNGLEWDEDAVTHYLSSN